MLLSGEAVRKWDTQSALYTILCYFSGETNIFPIKPPIKHLQKHYSLHIQKTEASQEILQNIRWGKVLGSMGGLQLYNDSVWFCFSREGVGGLVFADSPDMHWGPARSYSSKEDSTN